MPSLCVIDGWVSNPHFPAAPDFDHLGLQNDTPLLLLLLLLSAVPYYFLNTGIVMRSTGLPCSS